MSHLVTEAATLSLVCPDWFYLEHELKLPDPFVLWPVGDQPLLYHWFDYALDQGYKCVRIFVTDRPDRVREAVNQATLWPIMLEVVTVSQSREDDGVVIGGLPDGEALALPENEWDILRHWQKMDSDWLRMTEDESLKVNLSVGRLCRIHPTAKLVAPYLIGDHVAIGPGATIGPNAVVGSGSMVAEDTVVKNARLMPHSFLGAHLTLEKAILYGRVLFNCKHRARIERIESFIADSVIPRNDAPPWSERIVALGYWIRFQFILKVGLAKKSPRITLNGKSYPGPVNPPLWAERLPRIWEVVCGRMRLFGPLPRSDEQLEQIPIDWRPILREAIPGAIAYSDCLGCHDPNDPTEALHAVYQITHPEQTQPQCEYFLKQLTHH
ncbi:MAG: hypothetical protein AAFX93_01455 [Verrucomicrobiota bacterium]